MPIKITTNNVPREIIDGFQLTENERKEFDYIDWKKIEEGNDSASFFRYKGELYDLHEFMVTESSALEGWTGYSANSFFSGMVVNYVTRDHDEMVIIGRYCESN